MKFTEKEIKILLRLAYAVAALSPDTRTQVGVVLISQDGEDVCAYNEPSPGFTTKNKIYKSDKYAIMEHAERNVIFAANREGIPTKDSILISPWGSCADCSRAIVLSGVKKIYRHKELVKKAFPRWEHSIKVGDEILQKGGVEVINMSFKKLNARPIMMDGKKWCA
jgi:deoxycytidylate deaminase